MTPADAMNYAIQMQGALRRIDTMRAFFGTLPTEAEQTERQEATRLFYDALLATVKETK